MSNKEFKEYQKKLNSKYNEIKDISSKQNINKSNFNSMFNKVDIKKDDNFYIDSDKKNINNKENIAYSKEFNSVTINKNTNFAKINDNISSRKLNDDRHHDYNLTFNKSNSDFGVVKRDISKNFSQSLDSLEKIRAKYANKELDVSIEDYNNNNASPFSKRKPKPQNEPVNNNYTTVFSTKNTQDIIKNFRFITFFFTFFSLCLFIFSLLNPLIFDFNYIANKPEVINNYVSYLSLIVFPLISAIYIYFSIFLYNRLKYIKKQEINEYQINLIYIFTIIFSFGILYIPSSIIKEDYVPLNLTKRRNEWSLLKIFSLSFLIISFSLLILTTYFSISKSITLFFNLNDKQMYIYIIEILLYIMFFIGIFSSLYLIFFNKDNGIKEKNMMERKSDIKKELDNNIENNFSERTLGMGSLNKAIDVNELKQRAISREKDIISLTNFKEK